MKTDPPSDGSGPDAVIAQTNSSVADADQPPVMPSPPLVAVPDTELVGALEARRQIGFSSRSLLAAAQTAVSQEGVAAGQRRFMALPNFHELSTSDIPLFKTRKRLITWLVVGAAGAYAVGQIDFEHEEHGHKDRQEGR